MNGKAIFVIFYHGKLKILNDLNAINCRTIETNDTMIAMDGKTEVVIYGLEFFKKLNELLPKYDKRLHFNAKF